MSTLYRRLFCPICGQSVKVPTAVKYPETLLIPDHVPAIDVNLCQGADVSVTLDFAKCKKCGCNTMKTSCGLCRKCFREEVCEMTPQDVAAFMSSIKWYRRGQDCDFGDCPRWTPSRTTFRPMVYEKNGEVFLKDDGCKLVSVQCRSIAEIAAAIGVERKESK